jgi:protein SCO1/2
MNSNSWAPARQQRGWRRAVLGLGCALALLAGCSRSGSTSTASAPPEEKHYPLTGEILKIDVPNKTLVVRHEAIEGLMPGMTMEFSVSSGDAAVAKVGQHIRAQLYTVKTGNWRLESIWPDDAVAKSTIDAEANALRQDTLTRGNGAYREIGEKIPQFALYDQDGRVVDSARFAGKRIMLNFIYSRCPVANMCPASTMKMMAAQKLAREAGLQDFELVSITLDPAYDTPGVLKDYATARGIDTANFSFLTGPEKAVKDLLLQFGVIAEFQGNILNHTLSTLLIDEQGRIIHRADGGNWDPKEFIAKLQESKG